VIRIISHRGLWQTPGERNTRAAFSCSFDAGLGTETDLRDICGKIVISHDMPQGGEPSLEELLILMDGRNLPLALNIKADGMAEDIKNILGKYRHTNYFTFDMSLPELVFQLRHGLPVYAGVSDIMPQAPLVDGIRGVWLDCFNSDWYDPGKIDELVSMYHEVCIVSADLHKRNVERQWDVIRQTVNFRGDSLTLCTDKPLEAVRFFGKEAG
jgi:hypothetical protein